MLSEFRSLFKYNNFDHLPTIDMRMMNTSHRSTMTQRTCQGDNTRPTKGDVNPNSLFLLILKIL